MALLGIFKHSTHSFQITSAFISVKIQLEWYEIDNDERKSDTNLQNNHIDAPLILIHKIAYIN